MKVKTRGIVVFRKDYTVPMTKEEEQIAKQKGVEEFHLSKMFSVNVNNAIPFNHRICNEM